MREVVKTNVRRNQNSKRTRRRRRSMPLYFFLVVLLVIGIGVSLSMTLFFNIKTITVKGESDYANEDIVKISGIRKGDNLVRLDAQAAAKNIMNSMVYIEEVNIDKQYPDNIEIEVVRSVAAVNVKIDSGYLQVSKKGRILDVTESANAEFITIEGFESVNESLGTYLESADEQKSEILYEILDAVFESEENRITSVDMTDKYDIKINYEDRIIFELGNSNDISYKLSLADTVLDDLSEDKEGYMTMVGTNQVSFRSESAINNDARVPIKEEDLPEGDAISPENEGNTENSTE